MSITLDQKHEDVVKPLISVDDAIKNWKTFEELKSKLLNKNDYQMIGNKTFIKRSGWRKLAVVFNISDDIIEAKKTIRDDKSFIWEFTVKATAPNGRFAVATGSCDSKERNFAHFEHDVKATAHTRAKSRAISDVIGSGEVSAEEMQFEERVSAAKNVTPNK